MIFRSFLLGIIQGLTEFLPVSSSGHLLLLEKLLNFSKIMPPASLVAFNVAVHIASCLAIVIFLVPYFKELFSFRWLRFLVVGFIPTAVIGLLLKSVEHVLTDWRILPFTFLTTSVLLFISHFVLKKSSGAGKDIPSVETSLIMGSLQGIAIFPGISRSGAVLFGAIVRGLKPEIAVVASFFLAVPAIFGAALVELKDIQQMDFKIVIPGFIGSFIFSLIALYIVRYLVKRTRLLPFAAYTLILSVFCFLLLFIL